MSVAPAEISIALTMFRRLDFMAAALDSAVRQTLPVNVWVQDDGCDRPAEVQRLLTAAPRPVGYRRNPQPRGIFGNMNAALAACPTPWLSILHDDDLLASDFVARLVNVAAAAPGAALYFGGTIFIDAQGRRLRERGLPRGEAWRRVSPETFAHGNQFPFPGQLIHVPTARALGGFPTHAPFTGDWDLWFRLALAGGAVQVGAPLARYRCHTCDRVTTEMQRAGRTVPACIVQTRVNLARLRATGRPACFDRQRFLQEHPLRARDILLVAGSWSRRALRYHRQMLLRSRFTSRNERWLRLWSRVTGDRGLRLLSRIWLFTRSPGMRLPAGSRRAVSL
ncbi:glycosyltransferase family 2 protein [Horticoccus luteus]|uniref:Glycosyltransferase family 2 protein n=1 Tax=Horticoccus luteus TaxID=2862869 RepID=A0A8F9TYX9_9BACT|nr:glycosyltransferase [Horticoccus luteus]QYM80434.1 glycosyltransferase family 2 protein [Horticoccus luteus]